jgi:hypothetical protein
LKPGTLKVWPMSWRSPCCFENAAAAVNPEFRLHKLKEGTFRKFLGMWEKGREVEQSIGIECTSYREAEN